MAQMEVKKETDRVNAAIAELPADAGCPGCASGMSPEKAGMYLNQSNISVHIREIELGSGYNGPTVANAHMVRLPMGTLMVEPDGTGTATASGTSDTTAEIIADYDNDPVVKAYISNVTTVMGYANRTSVDVKHYAVDLKGLNVSQSTQGVFEVVTYTYTNQTTKYRFKFAATQSIDGNGKAIPPKVVVPGQEFPPLVEGKNQDAECWYWYVLIGIAVVAVITAIAASIALAAAGAGGTSVSYYNKMKASLRNPGDVVKDYQIKSISDPRGSSVDIIEHDGYELMRQKLTTSNTAAAGIIAKNSIFIAILIFLLLIGLVFPLVMAALIFLAACIIGLLVCKGYVTDANEKAQLEQMLNPEILVGISERENGQTIFVPSQHSSQVMIALPEKTEDGVPYEWNVTTDPASSAATMLLPDRDDPASATRGWMIFTPLNKSLTFSARYVPAFNLPGPEKKQFSVRIVPLVWSAPVTVDASSKWVGYGTSLAIDPKTDRMHISYLDYSGTWGDAGKLVYRSGSGTAWDAPVVVDDTISWTTTEGKELARFTSIALDPDGYPLISYMDWKNGHMKFARLNTWNKHKRLPPGSGTLTKTWWTTETVDASSSYAGWGSSIAVDSKGEPHIAYLVQDSFSAFPQLMYAHKTEAGWEIKRIDNAAGQVDGGDQKWWIENVRDGTGTSIAIDSKDQPHITYVDYNRAPKKDKTCHIIPKTHGQPDESCKFNLQLMYASYNGTGWVTEPVDNTLWSQDNLLDVAIYTWHGLYSSLAIDRSDHPHISYFSSWNRFCANGPLPIGGSIFCDGQWIGNLKYATNDGTGWSTQIADNSTNSVGLYSSLKVDRNLHPHISYMDWKNGNLRYATSHNGRLWFRSIPDNQNSDTGRFSSIAIDAQGAPRIVYMDYKSGHVMYVYGTFPAAAQHSLQASASAAETGVDPVPLPASFASEQIQVLPFPAAS
jgi:hypothetical protein